jgi:predicted transglutaminase-like cysteine proteinase
VVPNHTYSVGHVTLFVSLVLSAATGLRCASRVMALSMSFFGLSYTAPSWYAGRLWLLRLGYYKLTRPKEQAEDWVWIVDHTIQIGTDKCLVILGVRLSCLPPAGQCLEHEDVEPILLSPVKKSNGAIVYQQLADAAEKTGVPRVIVADHGGDVNAGITQFCQHHPQTCSLYDIKHKTAAILKRELKDDAPWNEFIRLCNETKRKVQQTPLAFLAPPNQRSKARYMNLDILVEWGNKALTYLERSNPEQDEKVSQASLEDKLDWLRSFRRPLQTWAELLQVSATTESFVRKQGLSRGCHRKLKTLLKPCATTAQAQKVRQELLAFVAEESLKAQPNERLLGSSEVIESIFGKLKRLEQDQVKSGFTGLVLALAAIVSTTTSDVVQEALQTVPTKNVLQWRKENLGQSIQAQRKNLLAAENKKEQKQDQILEAA